MNRKYINKKVHSNYPERMRSDKIINQIWRKATVNERTERGPGERKDNLVC